jgi:hypothetical protein
MRISDFQRRRILQLIKHFRVVRKARSFARARSMATSFPAARRVPSLSSSAPAHQRCAKEEAFWRC